MATQIPPGRSVNGYTIIEWLASGNAISYIATSPKEVSPGNRDGKVFFKQYKSPSVRVPWYKGYVAYQQEIKRRIDSTDLKNFACRIIDFFEAKFGQVAFFEVFEFVEKGHDLKGILDKGRSRPAAVSWDQRLILAKAMMGAIRKLHEAKIIHCDLKPANIQLIEDPSIEAKYRVKLIDMDSSVLADRRAPWHGATPYVGSDGYRSPEHLLKNGTPLPASDVFTCGIMLYELLAGMNPYAIYDLEEYAKTVNAYRARPPTLLGRMPFGNDGDVIGTLHQALSPDPRKRPSAQDLLFILNGRKLSASTTSTPEPSSGPEPHRAEISDPAPPPASDKGPLTLQSPAGEIPILVRTTVGQRLIRKFGEDARFWHEDQMVIEPREGRWFVIPNTSAPNETILNGKAVTKPTQIKHGDVIGAGRESKGVMKLPLTVRLS